MITETERPRVWYCPNCANPVGGLMTAKGEAKAVCGRCHTVMFRKQKNSKQDTIEMIASPITMQ